MAILIVFGNKLDLDKLLKRMDLSRNYNHYHSIPEDNVSFITWHLPFVATPQKKREIIEAFGKELGSDFIYFDSAKLNFSIEVQTEAGLISSEEDTTEGDSNKSAAGEASPLTTDSMLDGVVPAV